MSAENLFEKKSGTEPVGCIIKPDQAVYIKRRFAVVPGTGFIFSKEKAGYILACKNAACIDSSSQHKAFSF